MSERDFAVVTEHFRVGKNQLSQPHERVKSGNHDGGKEEVVVGRTGNHAIKDEEEVGMRKWCFPFDRSSKSPHTSCQGARDQHAVAIAADIREKGFELPAYARQVRVDGVRFDVTGKKNDIER